MSTCKLSVLHEMQAADARDFYSMLEMTEMQRRAKKIKKLFGHKHCHNARAFLGLSDDEYRTLLVEGP